MPIVRNPAVAGMFYPDNRYELQSMINDMLERAEQKNITPRALIAPHAGYIYSGEVAATAYKQLEPIKNEINRVVLMGPSHRIAFRGLALSKADYYHTPLGDIKLDIDATQALTKFPNVQYLEDAHTQEHSLEVHLPFLQTVLNDFSLVPITVGDIDANSVMKVLEYFWKDPGTLLIISSDLSHFHSYQTAQQMDRNTSNAIVHLRPEDIDYEDACGRNPILGLLELAKKYGLQCVELDVRNSGDTAGTKDQVVGYGAYGFF